MSPNVGNFVHDLVEMAKAMELLPSVQSQLDHANTMIEEYAKKVQDREIHILDLKAQLEEAHAKINAAEVARDDAEFRFLEADDRAAHAVNHLRTISASLGSALTVLEPAKAEEPKVEQGQSVSPFQQLAESSHTEPLGDNISQSSAPMNPTTSSAPEVVHSLDPIATSQHTPTNESANASSPHVGESTTAASDYSGPYSGLYYMNVPGYISRDDWKAGGGSDFSYDWREGQARSAN